MRTVFILFLLAFTCTIKAQEKCPPTNLYKTNFLGNGTGTGMRFPLNFIIKTDSLIIGIDTAGRNQFAAFRILNQNCEWNEDFSEGKSVYKLMIGDLRGNKYPTLSINSSKKQPLYIELLYENSEKGVFTQ